MAASLQSSENTFFKYESIRIEWTKYFENEHWRELGIVKDFFYGFHKNHRQLVYTVAKIFDGTTHVLVDSDDFIKIKNELERKTGKNLPKPHDIAPKNEQEFLVKERRTFPSHDAYRSYSLQLKSQNDAVRQRKRQEAISYADKLRRIIRATPGSTFLAFDIEVYEHDFDKMLEIGFVEFVLQPGAPREYHHYIITDNLHYVNGDRVPDNRDRFLFGKSRRMALREAAVQFGEHIAGADFLVAHSGANDEHYLSMQGIDLQGKQMFDTQVLALAHFPAGGPFVRGLSRILSDFGIDYKEDVMHNGGNDAAYTMEAFCALVKKL